MTKKKSRWMKAAAIFSILIITLSACSSRAGTERLASSAGSQELSDDMPLSEPEAVHGEVLIAYFTVPETDGVDTIAGASRVVADEEILGNTQYIAQLIHQSVGGVLFEISTKQEYPGSHDPLLEFAFEEKEKNARPELAAHIDNFDEYDTIFIGYPNWNADLPMPLYSFFEEYDFSGKTVIPFVTHGGSGFSRTVDTIAELEPEATMIKDGLSLSRNNVAEAQNDVTNWIQSLNLSGIQEETK